MKAILSAAASGIAVASVADIADKLLSTQNLPRAPVTRIPAGKDKDNFIQGKLLHYVSSNMLYIIQKNNIIIMYGIWACHEIQ